MTCIEWTGYLLPNGYGQCTWHQRKWLAHRRIAAERWGEAAIVGKIVMHSCDNKRCINPDHLVVGTQHDNVLDMYSKGRARNGNESKTHCPQGHEYEGRNVMVYDGRRHCRTCNRDRSRERYRATVKKKGR